MHVIIYKRHKILRHSVLKMGVVVYKQKQHKKEPFECPCGNLSQWDSWLNSEKVTVYFRR